MSTPITRTHSISFAMQSSEVTEAALNDPITEVAVLLAQSFREDRKQANDLSDAAEAARLREGEQQVQEMREKASAIRSEGWIRGLTTAASGGCSVIGAGLSFRLSDAATSRMTALFSGGGKAFEGMGSILGNGKAADAQEHQGEADLHDARATAHKVASEKYRNEADDAQRMITKVMDFLENVNESRHATDATASAIRA
jgi:hypothetical protein